MDLILITNDVIKASIAQDAGVDRVMIDLEVNGKDARQGHLDTVISRHSLADLARMREVLKVTKLLVRVNPMYAGSREEIERCLIAGADVIMLPMFTHRDEVTHFINIVRARALVCLLLETPQALVRAEDILAVPGIDEVHIGLNDLHLGMGLAFMFELLSCGFVDRLKEQVSRRRIKFGFGGVARLNQGLLHAQLILSEHVRLHSTQVILSRDFHKAFSETDPTDGSRFAAEVKALRSCLDGLGRCSSVQLMENAREVKSLVAKHVDAKHRVAT